MTQLRKRVWQEIAVLLQHETQLLGLLVRMVDQMAGSLRVLVLIWVKLREAGTEGCDQEGGFLHRSEERGRGWWQELGP